MSTKYLDSVLKSISNSEQFYLDHPGQLSPRYENMPRKMFQGLEVLQFSLPNLNSESIMVRKDSRFTFVPFYVHTNINLNYIYSGTCTYLINDEYITLNEGDVCIFDRDLVRSKLKTGENDIVINISISNDYFSSHFINQISKQSLMAQFIINGLSQNTSHDGYLLFKCNKDEKIISLFDHFLTEHYQKRSYFEEIQSAYLAIIFMELLRVDNTDNQFYLQHSGISETIINILKYIEVNYKTATLEEVATLFGYHPKYCSTIIKINTGHTFKQLQLIQRMNHACILLKSSEYSIDKICQQVGISNQNSFYKHFYALYKMTPSEFRKTKNI